MPRYLLDSLVLVDFQQAGALPALAAAAKEVPMSIVDEVYGELTIPPPGASLKQQARAAEAKRTLDGTSVQVLEILPGTPAAALFAYLRGGKTHDRGEAASVALAAFDADLVFVTGDKNGTLFALNELHGSGERVVRVPVFVRRLYEIGVLSAAWVRAIAPLANSHGPEPSWWSSWLSELSG